MRGLGVRVVLALLPQLWEVPTVYNDRMIVGLDVHGSQTQVASLDLETGELVFRRVNGPPIGVVSYLESLGGGVRAVYEAGPVGYGLARAAAGVGIEVRVCAPGSIPRKPNQRIKTDRRDAERLARLFAAGELSFVRVPTPEEEHFRDLVRCREALRSDLMRARHRLTKFLLRHDLRYPGSASNWTERYWRWLRQLKLDNPASETVLIDYLVAVSSLEQRRSSIDHSIDELWAQSPWGDTIARLRCMRGIDTLTASGLCAEIGEFTRFGHPRTLAAYLGLVPREHSSGETIRRGSITKAGSAHARRLLVEAAHHYRFKPGVSAALGRRQREQDPRACQLAWRCQKRLHHQYERLRIERKKPGNVVTVALARELSNYVWEIGQLH